MVSRPFAFVLALIGSSCAPDEPRDAKRPSSPTSAEAPAVAPLPDASPRNAFARLEAPAPEWDLENRRRLDPGADGWPSEEFHDRARPALLALLGAAYGAGPSSIDEQLDPLFRGASVLRPPLAAIHERGGVRVARAAAPSGELRPRRDLESLFAELRAPANGAAPLLELFVEGVERSSSGWTTNVRWIAKSESARGRVQQESRWLVAWSEAGAEAPRIAAIELLSYSEAASSQPIFSDHTSRWLGDARAAAEDFRAGLGELHFRNDQLTGNALLGGQGVAVGDLNADGLEDVYVPMQGGASNRLLLAKPDGTLLDASANSRVAFLDNTRSALIADFDGDGVRDLALAIYGNVVIAYNDGRGVFTDQIVLAAPGPEDIFSLAAADPDGDGDLDLYACRYVKGGMIAGVPTPYHDARNGASNVYWRNDGRGRFANATAEVGLDENNTRFSLAALWEDFDDDGDLDLYVANDFGRNNLFRNEGGRFRDVAAECGVEDMAAGMGVSVADFDLDGRLDLYVSNMYSAAGLRVASQHERFLGGEFVERHEHYLRHARGNTLLRGAAGGRFEDAGESFGARNAGWAWGALFSDFDGDGYEDLFSPNGFISGPGPYDVESYFWRRVISQSPQSEAPTESYRNAWGSMQRMVMEDGASYNGFERDAAFLNLGGRTFADVSFVAGLDALSDSRAAARIDWDDDGRLDLIVKSRTAPRLRLLLNRSTAPANFLAVELVGVRSNRDAIGARVAVELEGRTLTKTLYAGEGYLAQSSRRLHFGLGADERAASVTVRWPSGERSKFENVPANSRLRIVEGEARFASIEPRGAGAFEQRAPSPLVPLDAPVARMALVERMPMAPYSFPMLNGSRHKVRDFAGSPLLVTLWSAKGAGCVEELAALRRLVREHPDLRWIAATIDQGADLLEARKLADALGIREQTAMLDPHAAKLVELQFLVVAGRSHHVPLPASLLLDSTGQWSLAYFGRTSRETLDTDLGLLADLDPTSRGSSKLLGGRWLVRGKRDYEFLASVCRDLGANEHAEFYEQLAASESK